MLSVDEKRLATGVRVTWPQHSRKVGRQGIDKIDQERSLRRSCVLHKRVHWKARTHLQQHAVGLALVALPSSIVQACLVSFVINDEDRPVPRIGWGALPAVGAQTLFDLRLLVADLLLQIFGRRACSVRQLFAT